MGGAGSVEKKAGPQVLAVLSVASLAFFGVGCRNGGKTASPSGGATLATSVAQFAPGTSPGKRAVMRLGDAKSGTEFEVVLRAHKDGEALGYDLLSEGEVLEKEGYEDTAQGFRVVQAGVDAFAPGIDLLRYPAKDGAAWDWEGKILYAGVSRPARAMVSIHKDGEAVRSDVRLTFAVDPDRSELVRTMSFWFRKGEGLVRREFGDVSSRRPVGAAWPR